MPPAGSVVIVTFNSAQHIESCLRSVSASGWECVVVDNASRDDTLVCARHVPGVKVLANSDNRGFAAAANQGVAAASAAMILLLNPDAAAEPSALETLAAGLAPERVGAAAGRLTGAGGVTQVGFTLRRFPTLGTALSEVLLLNRLFPSNPWNRHYRYLDLDHERPSEVEQPAGACLLVKRAAWEQTGGFDEQFWPLWFEDVDFCRRLRARGWKILYEPRSRFRHAGGHSLESLAPGERQLFWYRNLLRYFRKHHGGASVASLRIGILIGMLLRLLATLLGASPEPGPRGAQLTAYAGVIRRCVFGGGRS